MCWSRVCPILAGKQKQVKAKAVTNTETHEGTRGTGGGVCTPQGLKLSSSTFSLDLNTDKKHKKISLGFIKKLFSSKS